MTGIVIGQPRYSIRERIKFAGQSIRSIAGNDFRQLRRDPVLLLTFTVMPLLVMAFFKPAFAASLRESGLANANGAEQAVPGMAVMFAFFLVSNLGLYVFSEHAWNTWSRLQASGMTSTTMLVGKSVVPIFAFAVQLSVLFGIGSPLFSLTVSGSWWGIVAVSASLSICLIALGYLLLSISSTVMHLNTFANLGAVIFAGLGGAIAPIDALPDWAATVAVATPSYWAMSGYNEVIIAGGSAADVTRHCLVLLGMAFALFIVAAILYNPEEQKVGLT